MTEDQDFTGKIELVTLLGPHRERTFFRKSWDQGCIHGPSALREILIFTCIRLTPVHNSADAGLVAWPGSQSRTMDLGQETGARS
jgi:hypothetical protein